MSLPQEVSDVVSQLSEVTDALLARCRGLTEEQARAASPLPGWTRGHVLSHLINQGDGFRRMMWGAAHGLGLQQYAGGMDQRNAELERNAQWSAETLWQELWRACDELATAVASMPEAGWNQTIVRTTGPMPAWRGLSGRTFEAAVHLVDLDLGYTAADWPASFVDSSLPDVAAQYQRRTAEHLTQSWSLECTDGAGRWTLGAGSPAGAIRGPGSALLAWLLAREDAGRLTIEGPAEAAAAIPRSFPYGSQYRP